MDRLRQDILFVLKHLYKVDADLVRNDTNERCLAARFFAYMQNHTARDPAFEGLTWDPEYNRVGEGCDPKEMKDGRKIIPDLILHRRGDNGANICAIEFKKEGRSIRCDLKKLAELTAWKYRYHYGVEIVIGVNAVSLAWIREGNAAPYSYETYDVETWRSTSFLDDGPRHERRRSCTLMITRDCNLHCTYCYEPFKCNDKTKEMTFETAQEILRGEFELVKNSADFDEIEIDFMGGEPLMNFPLIRQVVEWLEREPPPVPYICFATTNGTLVAQHEEWLRQHTRTLQLGGSYDGTPEMQRVNRGTGESFSGNIELMHDIYPEQGFHMVVSKETLPNLAEGVLSVQRKGYRIDAALAQGVEWTKDDARTYRRQLEKLASAYLGKDKSLKPINLLTRPMFTIASDPKDVEQKKFCGTGTHMVTYDYDGRKYGCHLFTPVVLGDRAVEIDKIDYESCEATVDPDCADCRLKGVCPTCAGFNYRYRGALGKRDHRWCAMVDEQMKVACAFQIKKLSVQKHHTSDEIAYAKHALEAWPILENLTISETERR